jgi:hypothetical protein
MNTERGRRRAKEKGKRETTKNQEKTENSKIRGKCESPTDRIDPPSDRKWLLDDVCDTERNGIRYRDL